ncbi:MAG: NlpC/P60 family protein, partial [Eubacteriales bacterium]|nr:NlpC/P60 family protein [Eubacteriales bacterium]
MLTKALNKKQIIIVSAASLALVLTAVGLDIARKSAPLPEARGEEATVSSATASEPANFLYSGISSKLTEIVEDKPYEPAPDVLNLAYFYPDGADTSDVINSYAGRLYTELTTMEAQYMADIYDMSDRTPLSVAQSLNLPTSRVMGKYNPNNASHNPDNPATWIVGSFKNANVAFYDGDGNRINAYSAVKEIMSLASVYSYYHGMYDYDSMRDYAIKLWKQSHRYSISLGNVYYCSGCLNKTIQEEAEEAAAQEKEQLLLEESLAKRTAASSGETQVIYAPSGTTGEVGPGVTRQSTEGSRADEATLFFDLNETQSAGASAGASSEAQPSEAGRNSGNETMMVTSEAETSLETAAATLPAVPAETAVPDTSAPPTSTAAPETQTTAAQEITAAGDEATFAAFSNGSGALGLSYFGKQMLADNEEATMFGAEAETVAETAVTEAAQTAQAESETAAAVAETAPETAAQVSEAAPESSSQADGPGAFLGQDGLPAESGTQAGEETTAAVMTSGVSSNESTLPAIGETAEDTQETSAAGEKVSTTCPGHIDLYITVTIYGIDDSNGLIKLDTIGSDSSNFNDEWTGWTDEMRAYANALNAEDWFKRYGLTISAINVRNPLTESEIDSYLSRLPADISQSRRNVIDFALHSVGKVPYYWGGKAYAPRYEANNFGTLVSPDTKGRVLRGLDCSGWVNWVYWSALGSRLGGESTSTLIGCGERISRSDLKPGDIIVRTGADAHVVMFLEWAGNGNMIVVH